MAPGSALAEAARVGGTCVIRGCVPKKLMHYGAHFAEWFEDGARLRLGRSASRRLRVRARCATATERRDRPAQRHLHAACWTRPACALLHGVRAGSERRERRVRVEAGERARSPPTRVLIAVGAQPDLPELAGHRARPHLGRGAGDVYRLPERLAVIGAGYIGVELASIFNGLGTETTLILRGDLPLRGFDARPAPATWRARCEAHGLTLRNETVVERDRARRATACAWSTSTRPAGRRHGDLRHRPQVRCRNTRGLGLEALGVRLHAHRRASAVDDAYRAATCEASSPSATAATMPATAWTAAQLDLTPVAIAEGRAVAERLFNDQPRSVHYDDRPDRGLRHAAGGARRPERGAGARSSATRSTIYKTSFRPMLHTLTGRHERTMMKLVVDKATDRVLGCHMVGDDAAEIIQGFAVAMTAGATKAQFDAHRGAASHGSRGVRHHVPAGRGRDPTGLSSSGGGHRWHAPGAR